MGKHSPLASYSAFRWAGDTLHRVRLLFFPENPPASTVVQVSGLLPNDDSRVEIDIIAHRSP